MAITRKPKTKQQIVDELKKLDEKREKLEQLAYASDIEELLKRQNIASAISVVKANIEKTSDLAILKAIVKICGFKRITVTQALPTQRKKNEK
jgi:hypothetical protein